MRLSSLALAAGVAAGLAAGPVAAQNHQARPASGVLTVRAGTPAATDLTLPAVMRTEQEPENAAGCYGVFNLDRPDVNVRVDDAARPLRLYARSGMDTVLMVRTPSGEWLCNDDTDGTNPAVMLSPAQPGEYNVWLGYFYGADAETPATLFATERMESGVDAAARPSGGAATMGNGFQSEPTAVAVTVGSDVGPPDMMCSGFFATAPAYNLNYTGDGSRPLFIYARPDVEDEDLTIAVNMPDGTWSCNDDADGLSPGVRFDRPMAGLYGVWVGSFRSRARTESPGGATLFLSEVDGPDPATMYDGMDEHYDEYDYDIPEGYSGGEGMMRDAAPSVGTVSYGGDGTLTREVQAGGADVNSVIGLGCTGYLDASAPTLAVDHSGGNLSFWATADEDATLTIGLPDGGWTCNDDYDGLMPGVVVEDAAPGRYTVWVGTFGDTGATVPATLHVSNGALFGQ